MPNYQTGSLTEEQCHIIADALENMVDKGLKDPEMAQNLARQFREPAEHLITVDDE